jgi:hypothetical protein
MTSDQKLHELHALALGGIEAVHAKIRETKDKTLTDEIAYEMAMMLDQSIAAIQAIREGLPLR